MDIEKLIERLRNNNIENNCHDCALGYYAFEAATALSTLQAENEKLQAELEQAKRERDAAVEYLRGQCRYCKRDLVCTCRKGPHSNCWEWRGPKKED